MPEGMTTLSTTEQFRERLQGWIDRPPEDLAKLLDITPAMAEVMMERNSTNEWRNRPMAKHARDRYARNMATWVVTGETIIFSKSGNLLNGQTRLSACIAAGVPFRCLVVFGIEDRAFNYMDIGTKRSVSHIFAIHDVPNAKLMAAAIGWLWDYEHRQMYGSRNADADHEAIYEFYLKHQDISQSVPIAGKVYRSEAKMSQPLCAFLHYICARCNRSQADIFFEKVATGLGFDDQKDPAYVLRNRLILNQRSVSKAPPLTIAALTVKAWNAMRAGSKVGTLKWRGSRAPDEAFPRAK